MQPWASWTSVPNFMDIVQAVNMLNSISRARLNFRRRPILYTTLYRWFDLHYPAALSKETLCKQTTLVAHLTNFSFEFFCAIFTQDTPLRFLYHGAKSKKMTKNSNQGGGGFIMTCTKRWLHNSLFLLVKASITQSDRHNEIHKKDPF